MDVSDLRKRILRALDDARKDQSTRREHVDQAGVAYEKFLSQIAVPLFRQAGTVLRAEGHEYTVNTPAGSVRLVSDRSAQEFIEIELDGSTSPPQVIGRTSQERGRKGLIVEERPLATGKAIHTLTEDDVSKFLISEIRRLVMKA